MGLLSFLFKDGFQKEFQKIRLDMAEKCLQYAEIEVQKIYMTIATDEESDKCDFFYQVDGKIVKKHELKELSPGTDVSLTGQGRVLQKLGANLEELRALHERHNKTLPQHIEWIYDTKAKSFEEPEAIGHKICQVAEEVKVTCSMEQAEIIAAQLKEKTMKEVVAIELNTKPVGLFDSKFGGLPYIPRDGQVPVDDEGQNLRLLAQIALKDLPKNQIGLPKEGLLQFWAMDDDITGLETSIDGMLESKGHRVLYYEQIDTSVTESEVSQVYYPEEESYFPIQDTFGIHFQHGKEGITVSDCTFDATFVKVWNLTFPQEPIGDTSELVGDEAWDYIYDSCSDGGHKIGGYPLFTQYDPREGGMEDYRTLLLQIDSFGADGKEIMWGDSGVANFFITEEDLQNRDFTKVLYTWDCY